MLKVLNQIEIPPMDNDEMSNYVYDIKISSDSRHQGFIEGTINEFLWFAIVHNDNMEFGINSETLNKGNGKVSRLCIYKDSYDVEGNPYLPSLSIKRLIYANYQREWTILSSSYRKMVQELVRYLERRYSLKIVK
ncbi:hypothetical protein [Helicovermis profundi]|uniref:Uncharacterized protein n=1 Tax=Helicovermis profundi TaxID=3065157 RepID=A0AAU9EK37_9FIRM|nr:hypothetical protein HLPR_06650 [Clostridia bacterium S502]